MKKLLKELKGELIVIRDIYQKAYDSRQSLIIRPYRCGQNAKYIDRLIKRIDKHERH